MSGSKIVRLYDVTVRQNECPPGGDARATTVRSLIRRGLIEYKHTICVYTVAEPKEKE